MPGTIVGVGDTHGKDRIPGAVELTFWCDKQETTNIVCSDECCEEK